MPGRTQRSARGPARRPRPNPGGSSGGSGEKITNVVILFMENHTTDNVASDVPGVNGNPALPLSQDIVTPDPPHDHEHWMVRKNTAPPGGARRERFNAAMMPKLYKLMNAFTVCDNYFSDYAGNSFPNHCFAIGADAEWADRNPGARYTVSISTPGVPARLAKAGKTWANYGKGFAFQQYKDPLMHKNVKTSAQFMIDAKAGKLPNVSWVYAPGGQDFHPGKGTSMRASDAWLGNAVSAIRQGPGWSSTMVFITFDDWGGWDDHVDPAVKEVFPPGTVFAGEPYRFGSRVPCIVVGPYARPNHVSHDLVSHVSLVAFIERLWKLAPSPNKDAARRTAADLAMSDCYDLNQPPLNPPQVP
jgi:phospholipase C